MSLIFKPQIQQATILTVPRAGRPGFDFRLRKIFSLLHSVQTCSGVRSVSYPMETGGYFPGDKAAEA
jgi:hypothetical protein